MTNHLYLTKDKRRYTKLQKNKSYTANKKLAYERFPVNKSLDSELTACIVWHPSFVVIHSRDTR